MSFYFPSPPLRHNQNNILAGKDPGSKLEQGQKLGKEILTEEQFTALLKDSGV